MIPFNIAALLRGAVNIPSVDLAGCDVLMWNEEGNVYWLEVGTGEVFRVRDGKLARFITDFPRDLTLCIMNDKTGKPVRISPLAN